MSLYNQGYEEENEKTVGQSADDINARGRNWFVGSFKQHLKLQVVSEQTVQTGVNLRYFKVCLLHVLFFK